MVQQCFCCIFYSCASLSNRSRHHFECFIMHVCVSCSGKQQKSCLHIHTADSQFFQIPFNRLHHLKPIRSMSNKSPAEQMMILILVSKSFRKSWGLTHVYSSILYSHAWLQALHSMFAQQIATGRGRVNARMFLRVLPRHRPLKKLNWISRHSSIHTSHKRNSGMMKALRSTLKGFRAASWWNIFNVSIKVYLVKNALCAGRVCRGVLKKCKYETGWWWSPVIVYFIFLLFHFYVSSFGIKLFLLLCGHDVYAENLAVSAFTVMCETNSKRGSWQ